MKIKIKLLSVFAALIVVVSCNKSPQIASYQTDLLAPLAFGTLSLNNYDGGDKVQLTGSDTLHVYFEDTVFSLGLEDLIGIPDTSVTEEFVVPVSGLSFPPGVPFYGDTIKTTYKIAGAKLKFAKLRSASVKIKLSNTVDKPVLFTYNVLSATKNGQVFKIEELVAANSNFTKIYNLDGYDLDLRGVNGNLFNTINGFFTAMIDPNETQNHSFTLGDKFSVENTFQSIVLDYVTGSFGSDEVLINDSVAFGLTDNYPFDLLDITDFDLNLKIDNGIGADLGLKVNAIQSYSSKTDSLVSLNHSIIGGNISLNRAVQLYQNDDVKHQQKQLQFNGLNSNLDELIEISPSQFVFDLGVNLNPYGNISLGNDFAFYKHKLSMIASADVPLSFALGRLHLKDTVAYKLDLDGDTAYANRLNSGFLKLQFENGYPLEAQTQVYVLDSGNAIIDSLFSAPFLINGAPEVAQNANNAFAVSYAEVALNQAKLDRLKTGDNFLIDMFLSTTDKQLIRISSANQISYKIALECNATLP